MVASPATRKPKRPFSACYVAKDKDDSLLSVLSNEDQLSNLFNKCPTTVPIVRRRRRKPPKLKTEEDSNEIRSKTILKTTQRGNSATSRITERKKRKTASNTNSVHPKTKVNRGIRRTNIKKLIIPLIRIEDLPLSELLQLVVTPNYVEKIHGCSRHNIQCSQITASANQAPSSLESQPKRKRTKSNQKVLKVMKTLAGSEKILGENHTIKDGVCNNHPCSELDTRLNTVEPLSSSQSNTVKVKRRRKIKVPFTIDNVLSSRKIGKKTLNNNRRVKEKKLWESRPQETTNSSLSSIEQFSNNNHYLNHETSFKVPHVIHNEFKVPHIIHEEHINEIEKEMRELKLMTNGTSVESTCNGQIETFSTSASNLDAARLSENILTYFLNQKKIMASNEMGTESEITNTKEMQCANTKVGKVLAMCLKCKQVLHLLQQLRHKVNFINGEQLSIECTLCNLHINSLCNLQQHVMDVHLQCDGKLSSKGGQFPAELVNSHEIINSKSIDAVAYECCCCPQACNNLVEFQEHMDKFHPVDIINKQIDEQVEVNREPSNLYGITKMTFSDISVVNETIVHSITDNANTTEISNENEQHAIEAGSHENVCTIMNDGANIKNCTNLNKSVICFKDALEHEELGSFSDSNMCDRNTLMGTTHGEERSLSDSDMNYIKENETLVSEPILKNILNERIYSKIKDTSTASATNEFNLPHPLNNQLCELPKKLSRRVGFPYICKVCHKKYRKKHLLLSHVKKHVTDINCDIRKVQNEKVREAEDSITAETSTELLKPNGVLSPNSSAASKEECLKNREDDDAKLNSVQVQVNLEDVTPEQNNSSGNTVISNVGEEETEAADSVIVKEILMLNKTKILNRHCARDSENSMDSEKKLDVNDKKVDDVFLTSSRTDINLTLDSTPVHECSLCDKKFDAQRSLMEHMFFIHDSNLDEEELSSLLVPYLNESEETKNIFVQDAKDSLQKVLDPVSKVTTADSPTSKDKANNKVLCEYEEKNINTVGNNRKWRCNLCKENFALIRNYLRHKYYSHNDESVVHVCSNCSKVITSVAMVNIHMCTNVTSWNCDRCNLDFTDSVSLSRHNVDRHYEVVGPHICDVCNLSFLTSYMMERHRSVHDVSNDQVIVNNVIDTSVFIKDTDLPLSSTTIDIEDSENQIQQSHDIDRDIESVASSKLPQLPERTEVTSRECSMSNSVYLSDEDESEEQFKCMLCNLVCLTKVRMKLHLAKQHNVRVDICRLCSNLYVTDGLANHLINRHIVLNDYNLNHNPKGGDANSTTKTDVTEDSEVDLVKVLGFKRLLSLYEYHRFNDVPKNERFNCAACLNTFSNIQQYRSHYLEAHDMMCLLCNIQFKHTVQAMDHKVKSHISVDSYLWVIQKIIAAILQLNKYGNTIDDIILKFSETGTQNDDKNGSSKKHEDHIRNFDIEIPEFMGLTDWNATIEDTIHNSDLLLKIGEAENGIEISGTSDTDLTNTDSRYASYSNGMPLLSVASCHVDSRNLFETCFSHPVDESANGSINEPQVSEEDKLSALVVTEDALRLYKDDINAFVCQLRTTGKIPPEEYLTKLLADHIQNSDY